MVNHMARIRRCMDEIIYISLSLPKDKRDLIEKYANEAEHLASLHVMGATLPEELRGYFSPTEAQIFTLLLGRMNETVSKEYIHDTMYVNRADSPEIKIIDVYICKLRDKFRKYNLPYAISTDWGRGYYLSNEPSPPVNQKMVRHREVHLSQ